ncbi:MAG: PKD domain-containing protein, partial [Bacteroidia bacterium]
MATSKVPHLGQRYYKYSRLFTVDLCTSHSVLTRLRILLFTITALFIQNAGAQIVADFSSDITEGCSPVTIEFSDASIGSNLRYRWSFGNGNVSVHKNPQAIFYKPGKYTISLEITDSTGKKSLETKKSYITVFKNPVANLSGSPLFGCAPLKVDFNNNSIEGDAAFKKVLWDFGDGNTLVSDNPSHTYRTDGRFNVSLLVIDSNNCEDKTSINNYVEVDRIPDINFTSSRRNNCIGPFEISFT